MYVSMHNDFMAILGCQISFKLVLENMAVFKQTVFIMILNMIFYILKKENKIKQ